MGMSNTTQINNRRPAAPMTPIVITRTAPRLSVSRPGTRISNREIWSARSTDGTWTYERSDEPGTPWIVTYAPTGHVEYWSSLPKARRWTASDRALADIRRMLEFARQRSEAIVLDGQLCDAEAITGRLVALTALAILTA